MEIKNPLQSKETKQNMKKANVLFFGFVLILAFMYLVLGAMKIGAVEATITGTEYKKDGENKEDFIKVDLINGQETLTFIQGNGIDSQVAIKFTLTEFPVDATSFMIVESGHSDSSGEDNDADRYNKNDFGVWVPSTSNITSNDITGSAEFSTDDNGNISVKIVYRLREGDFGLNFLRVYFYNAEVSTSNPSSSIDVFYVISKPIDTVGQGTTCTSRGDTICTDYVNGDSTRESRELKIYIPETVAYVFNALNNGESAETIINSYLDKTVSTVYAINYFTEDAGGEVSPVENKEDANRTYLYTKFTKQGNDTQAVTDDLIDTKNAIYANYIGTKASNVDFLSMKVDSTGAYFFYISDIFGNTKEIVQNVTDVKNRSIITEIKKGNANEVGYGAAEAFTNESVAVTVKMTVETNFEFGECLEEKCTEIINLTSGNVKQIKYWRVNITLQNGVDMDAYLSGDPVSKNYASEIYAANGEIFNLFCQDASACTGVQNYDAANINNDNGAGYSSFNDNILTMFVANSGRYRFYIEDIYGNNTWGTENDRVIEEFRNPRVEVYAIDKSAPEITFDYTDVINVNGTDLKMFDIETYEYYRGIELLMNSEGKFELDARITGTDAVAGIIENQIYYTANRDSGRALDVYFTNVMAIYLSKVRASEYVYYYSNEKDLLADFSTYDREIGSYYVVTDYVNDRVNTISRNTKNNSNGLLITDGSFNFDIAYYHNDGVNRVCTQIGSIDGYEDYATRDELDCVNYYLDHGVDFIIEFTATDFVGNVSSNRVYVNVIDTTPAGFTAYSNTDNAIKSSNIGTDCRMEIGSEIGYGRVQNKTTMLNCYNVILNQTTDASNNVYNFEDNVYNIGENAGLSFYNRINSNNYVKLYVLSDDGDWIDLETRTFIPNKTGYYSLKIEIHDATIGQSGTNVLTVQVSYYVDRKIVLIEPLANEKFYGTNDVTFDYCVYIDTNNRFDIRFSDNPYSDVRIYTRIYCTNFEETLINAGKAQLFQENTTSDFAGALSRLESIWYNQNLDTPIMFGESGVGVENNYVGLYRIILGTLNINTTDNGQTQADDDYIIKIHPSFRDETKYKGTTDDNLVTNQPLEDDEPYAQSSVDFTIKQIVVQVNATGGSKNYGDQDTNYANYNDDTTVENKYLNGFTVTGLKNEGQYSDTISVILGVLRREIGENVGVYNICNYRGIEIEEDTTLEAINNMYLNCLDTQTPGITFSNDLNDFSGYTYENGVLVMNSAYINSRALYVSTNKAVEGRTLNTVEQTVSRDNVHANYVIKYEDNDYIIESIDLVVQAAPGQRREYNYTNPYDPDPWEIILYGLVDGNIKRTADDTFNGYTSTMIEGANYYGADDNEKDTENGSEASKLEANKSEERTTWYLYHDGIRLTGYKTNETYQLLRSVTSGSTAGSAKLVREAGINGGWYLYKELSNDLNISGISAGVSGNSDIAVVTNSMNNCSYDTTGHIVSVNGDNPCKNYNLVYNPYYTNESGYTIEEHPDSVNDLEFVYKSNGQTCLTLDDELVCSNTTEEPQKIYKILYEIYRREIVLEFNSAIEQIKTVTTVDGTSTIINVDTVYGQRYNFYNTNFFDINYYTGKTFYPEDYLFICYNGSERSGFNSSNAASTGCTGDYRFGLTAGDSWVNLGLTFKMHDSVSSNGSVYYDEDDRAIPAGVYYIYADIAEDQKVNYNFKYRGGTMTIKSLSVNIIITSFLKEYGEAYYSKYSNGTDYASFTAFTRECLLDGQIINSSNELISLAEGVYCGDSTSDVANSNSNIYGFHVSGLDIRDTIANNFLGRPHRDRSVSLVNGDVNGLQDNVGIYNVGQGSIATINNNPFVNSTNACTSQVLKGEINDCVVAAGKEINNYVIAGEEREYIFDMVDIADITSENPIVTRPTTTNGSVIIEPATLKITVTANQTKMYGCAYNTFNTNDSLATYDYEDGYANCEEEDGSYYDLGYEYTVEGDKDYQIARNGFSYTSNDTYNVSGILGSTTFRPTTATYGIKAHALNSEGTLYRIMYDEVNNDNNRNLLNSSFAASAIQSQLGVGSKSYQGQTVGRYIITLGNVNASVNGTYDNMANTCDQNNMPAVGGKYACKNYHINYYETKAYNTSDGENDIAQSYVNDQNEFPSELIFTITKRTVYVYTNYDQKIYGNPDQEVAYMCGDYNNDGVIDENDNVDGTNGDIYYGHCTAEQVANNLDLDTGNNVVVEYGLTRYYTKYNSLAKAPWNGLGVRNDVQFDVIGGKISRKGMNNNAPLTDDIKAYYDYVYDDETYGASVALKAYGASNYEVNYYKDGLAVNEKGETTNEDGTLVKFEIVLRQIKIAFVSFDKVYGEHDVVTDYDILVCAPSETFDYVNKKCTGKLATDQHGLSAAHLSTYVDANGNLDQEAFKAAFVVRFTRVLGENVSCGTSSILTQINVTLNGYFFGVAGEVNVAGTEYTKSLNCNTTRVEGKSVYETLAYIDQSTDTQLGYNYQVNYTIGHVNIKPRPVLITPDEGQGFVYGDYHDTLIPHISYTDKVNSESLVQTYGLVNDVSSSNGVCLKNINYYNNGVDAGTCFNINDRIDEYNIGSSKTTSAFVNTAVASNVGLSNLAIKNFIFGDVYTSEASTRSALNRVSDTLTTAEDERYNRNVGVYTITIGDLKEKTAVNNYEIDFTEGIKYTITPAELDVTPERTDYEDTTQHNQYKIYGEQDKELTFRLQTTYTVTNSHYAKYNSYIINVCSSGNVCVTRSNLVRTSYNSETDIFTTNEASQIDGEYIYLNRGDIVTLDGFAYGENSGDINKNYGANRDKSKTATEEAVNQAVVSGSQYYDRVCKDKPENVGCNTDRTLSYGDTTRILLGYLYVEGYAQGAGTYDIMNGFVVANNELSNKNYVIDFTENVPFTIIPRPVGVQIQNVVKTYGQTTDMISCEIVGGRMIEGCAAPSGVLNSESEGYLRNNFLTEYFNSADDIESIISNDITDNSILYSQNGTFVNGLVPGTQNAYSSDTTLLSNVGENKNTEHLGVYVSRDERNQNNNNCMYVNEDGVILDTYGFCEDVGVYNLRFYGYYNTIDSVARDPYSANYKPNAPSTYAGLISSVSDYYYNSYWGYNPNYFVIVVESDTVENSETDEIAVVNPFAESFVTTDRVNADGERILKATGTLTINAKEVKMYVNTSFYGENPEVYYIQQNTNPPSLPTLNNEYDLKYENFDRVDENDETAGRQPAVGGSSTYGNIVWGRQPSQVRTGDQIVGELAYCNIILEQSGYDALLEGLGSDYNCANLLYEANKNSLDTNLTGYVPIVRNINTLSIVNQNTTSATPGYENNNYIVTFYPGALRIEEDNTKPVVQVNKTEVYIEANAIGEYSYECVGKYNTTTYIGAGDDTDCSGISIIGKTELTSGDPILSWLNGQKELDVDEKDLIIRVDLPTILNCSSNEHECTSSAFYQLIYGKGQDGFRDSGGIRSGIENEFIYPFTMQKDEYINNTQPASLKELVITLVEWFGVTAYDEGEIRNGQILDKDFDKYWYIVIEKAGTNGNFEIDKVGEYKVHFYVMDNAGNVSEGNMRTQEGLQATYTNVGTLHIIDTTKPVVGNLNLYNGRVECLASDCTIEENWTVADDVYVAINTLGRYESNGTPSATGLYVVMNDINAPVLLSSLTKYSRSTSSNGDTFVVDSVLGKYIMIPKGTKAVALKHYSWTNSDTGIWLTITGGSDNSYTETSFSGNGVVDYSQWNHYFSRDGGLTWFLYERTSTSGYFALDAEGSREIMIKAVDSGVRLETSDATTSSYIVNYYGESNSGETVSVNMDIYNFVDSSRHDKWLKDFDALTNEEKADLEETRHSEVSLVGWNISDWSTNDSTKAEKISLLIYGEEASETGYEFYRDRQMAYLDRTKPVIEFGTNNGEKLYIYEYGCTICTTGYTEYYAGATDSYPGSYVSNEVPSTAYSKNNSILINHTIYDSSEGGKYQLYYTNINQESLTTTNSVGGLGSDQFAMNGTNTGQDIRNIYSEERKYVIYSFTESGGNTVRVQTDLSRSIPKSATSNDGESSIYDVIMNTIPSNYSGGDVTYTIVYSVIDKAGNESVYIARGVVFVQLKPTLVVSSNLYSVETTTESVYYMNAQTGDDINSLVNSLNIDAGSRKSYLTQTVYYNGELVVDNKRYDPLIYDGFNTDSPGVYEIEYNLEFVYYRNGQSEMIKADPIKLVINVEVSPPLVNTSRNINYTNIILLMTLLIGGMFIGLMVIKNKKRI